VTTTLQLVSAGSLAADLTSSSVTSFTSSALFELAVTGATAAGTLKVQGSISESNWVDMPLTANDGEARTTIPVSGAATHGVLLRGILEFVRLRVVYTYTSGTGTLNAWVSQ
jgi:hypothetical protein